MGREEGGGQAPPASKLQACNVRPGLPAAEEREWRHVG